MNALCSLAGRGHDLLPFTGQSAELVHDVLPRRTRATPDGRVCDNSSPRQCDATRLIALTCWSEAPEGSYVSGVGATAAADDGQVGQQRLQ